MKRSSKKDLEQIGPTNPAEAMQWLDWMNPNWRDRVNTQNEDDENKDDYTEVVLVTCLKKALPMWVERLKKCSFEYVRKRQHEIPLVVGAKGDILLYGGKKKGETAKVFNDFAEGVAILAMLPKGGVELFGERFDYPCPDHWNRESEIYKHDLK